MFFSDEVAIMNKKELFIFSRWLFKFSIIAVLKRLEITLGTREWRSARYLRLRQCNLPFASHQGDLKAIDWLWTWQETRGLTRKNISSESSKGSAWNFWADWLKSLHFQTHGKTSSLLFNWAYTVMNLLTPTWRARLNMAASSISAKVLGACCRGCNALPAVFCPGRVSSSEFKVFEGRICCFDILQNANSNDFRC